MFTPDMDNKWTKRQLKRISDIYWIIWQEHNSPVEKILALKEIIPKNIYGVGIKKGG